MRHAFILAMVLMGLAACSPGDNKASKPAAAAPSKSTLAKSALAKAADRGHTPHPVAPIVDEDLFHGWRCGAGDCSLHQAGYAWASQHKIVNPQDCQEQLEKSKSESFIEGCWAYTGAEGPFGHKEIFQDED